MWGRLQGPPASGHWALLLSLRTSSLGSSPSPHPRHPQGGGLAQPSAAFQGQGRRGAAEPLLSVLPDWTQAPGLD